jgi:dTDP-4-dehydrorhamnose reductase
MKKNGILILGASGFIGKYLFDFFKKKGINTIGTYNHHKREDLVFFDVTKSPIEKLPLKNLQYGIICSAVAKIDECKKDMVHSNKVNKLGLEKVVKNMLDESIIPVFISGTAVFDDFKGGYKETDLRKPKNIYGLQKKQMEDFIISNSDNYLIIRLGKVFGTQKGDEGIFFDWIKKYQNCERIACAYDENLSLTYVRDVVKGISKLLEKNKRGIFHIDSGIHKSRLEFAEDFFKYLNINDAKIEKCSLDDFNFADGRAKNPYLDASKFIEETGFKFTPLEECYKIIKTQI